jgi:hypothetical protein
MKRFFPTLLLLLFTGVLFAQTSGSEFSAIDKVAMAIPEAKTHNTQDIAGYVNSNFTTEGEKVRAIFIWVASSLQYDVDNMYAFNYNETKEAKIARALKNRKGICENYAAVFDDICKKSGLKSEIVVGYTRQEGANSFLRHGWCAVRVNNEWQLFDPTWGSGVIVDNSFEPRINNEYFRANPVELIKTHMPFDPMWQMLHYTVTNREFKDHKTAVNKSKTYFSYKDTINAYEQLNEIQQLEAGARRLQQNGINNELVHDWLTNVTNNIEVKTHNQMVAQQNKVVDIYNAAIAELNAGISNLNDFINYRNKQFMPMKSDEKIRAMLDTAEQRIARADRRLKSIKGAYDKIDELMLPVQKSMRDLNKTLEDQKVFLAEYMGRGKLGRKTMFRKYTMMGVPLN